MELAPGTVLLGKYRVDEVLGTGGMGRVVRASHQYLQQSVAIKVLLPQMTESPSTVARFLREAQATVRLKNEHIARVIDVGTMPDGTPFMVMEYLEGNDLNQILRHHGPQTPNIVVDLMLQACEGMSEAHALGIVHRDIKPSNYFITRRPDGSMLLKILDFGISKTPVNFEELTGTQTVLGTPSYMAPEQMKSGKQADARSDIWSMGVVMYQMLQGRPPFSGESYAELVLKVGAEPPNALHVPLPPGLGEVIFRCLEKDPKLRPQDVGELARSLAPFASDPVSSAQIAVRTTRILSQRNSGHGFGGQQGLPVAAGGGLTAPVPLSPAQLTPRSWPPSPTSLSQGRGQVTLRTKSSKGWLVAGALSLVILAGAGGYIASSLRRSASSEDTASEGPTVHMPATAPPAASTTPPPAAPTVPAPTVAAPTVPAPTVATPAVRAPTVATPTVATTKTAAAPTVATPATPETKTAPTPKTAPTAAPKTETKAETKTAPKTETKAETKTAPKTETKTVAKTETKTAPKPKTETKAAPKTETKTTAKTAPKTETKTTTKTTTKTETKPPPKKGDLFDSRH